MTAVTPILARVHALPLVLDSAASYGLPMPLSASVGMFSEVNLVVWTLDDWKAWHTYLTGDGDPARVELHDNQLWLYGQALECPVEVVHVDTAGPDGVAAHYAALVAAGMTGVDTTPEEEPATHA